MDIQEFSRLYAGRLRTNKEKKISAIESYFFNKFQLEYTFGNDIELALTMIKKLISDNPDEESTILDDLASILLERYSAGIPFSISELDTSFDMYEIEENMKNLILDKEVQIENMKFHSCEEVVLDDELAIVSLKFKYIEYFEDPRENTIAREKNSGTMEVYFDLENRLFITTLILYSKPINSFIEVIHDNFHPHINIKPFYLQSNLKTVANKVSVDYPNLTLFSLNLIFSKFSKIGYEVLSLDSITFNNEQAPRVKTAKLTGTDLLSDPDVIERIYNCDKITKFTVTLAKFSDNGRTLNFMTDLTVDFKGMLKFIFENQKGDGNINRQVTNDLYHGIFQLLEDENVLTDGQLLLRKHLQRVAFDNRPQFNAFVYDLRNELINLLPELRDSFNKFFQEKYNLEEGA